MDWSKWIESLRKVDGLEAIVIGGSTSRNDTDAYSDIDIGLYYHEGINWATIEKVLREQSFNPALTLALPGTWGEWVNGGCWMEVGGVNVDILFRETTRVASVLKDCINGQLTRGFQPGHPAGFVSSQYAAEVFHAQVLWEAENRPIQALKNLLTPYSVNLKRVTVEQFLFEATFAYSCAQKPLWRKDSHSTIGFFYQAVNGWNQILYALNEQYFMNEKGSTQRANRLPLKPEAYLVRVNQTYHYIADHNMTLANEEWLLLQKEIDQLLQEAHIYP